MWFKSPSICYRDSGLDIKTYRYYDHATCGLDFKGCLQDLLVSFGSTNIVRVSTLSKRARTVWLRT